MDKFSIEVHHGEKFMKDRGTKYEGGKLVYGTRLHSNRKYVVTQKCKKMEKMRFRCKTEAMTRVINKVMMGVKKKVEMEMKIKAGVGTPNVEIEHMNIVQGENNVIDVKLSTKGKHLWRRKLSSKVSPSGFSSKLGSTYLHGSKGTKKGTPRCWGII
ncbi:hypothetical protein VNO77_20351 [Canavalia gladiata]|uniref:Uncharacterized protein n=1 Tax=Canavalia gladiata TaxID=3824 RepID=A0AAN9LPY3_CANGL